MFVDPANDLPDQSFCYVTRQIETGKAFQFLPVSQGYEVLVAAPPSAKTVYLRLGNRREAARVIDGFAFVSTSHKLKDQRVVFSARRR